MTWHPGHGPENPTEVTVSFVEVVGGQTLVTLEHAGWERLADPTTKRENYRRGWPSVLERFAARAHQTPVAPADDRAVWLVLQHCAGSALGEGERVHSHPDFPEHLAFLRRLDEAGLLVAAGPLEGADGMAVVRLPSAGHLAEVTRQAQDEDLAVARGLLDVRVRPWSVALVGAVPIM